MTAKDLKNALLQEAVQGKLVPQIASEGNARDLLEEIRKKRGESLPLATARKRSSATPSAGTPRNAPMEISEDEIPFDIPESWCWCRLGELGNFIRGSGIKRDETTKTGFPCVRYGEMYTTYKLRFSQTKSFTSKEVFDKCHKIYSNDILMALTGENKWDIALAAVYEGNDELAMGGDLCKFTPCKCDSLFLVYLINSPYGIEYKRNTSTGDIIVHTSTSKLGNFIVPLPPLAEQKRIVAAIEKFMPLIEEYGKKETILNELNAQIGTLTKKAILQEAVQGKLVPQIPAEGNVKDLLEQIKAQKAELIKEGKIKKEKPLPEITEDEIPFDIPENWCWCRLGDVTSFNGGYAFKSEKYTSNGIRVLRISDFNETGIVNKSPVYYPKTLDLECYKIQDNDIVMCMTGGTVGKTYHFKKLEEEYYVNQRVADLKCSNLINDDYVYLVIQNSYIKRRIDECKNSTNDNISADLIQSFVFPLPPLSEQKRIVAAIEQLLPLCERLGK